MKLPDFEAWAIFACVAEHRSFSGAAHAVGVSKATVSKAITRLETDLGTSLFHRTSRRLSLTDSGRRLEERARRIVAEAQAAEEDARQSAAALSGVVRVAAPMSLGLTHLAPAVAEFLLAHPGIEIDLHLSDAQVDIVADGVDIALRIADLPDSSLRARRIAGVELRLVAAPGYLAAHGTPAHPADLHDHHCMAYTNAAPPYAWRFRGPHGDEVTVRPTGPLSANSGEAMLPALVAGLGIALLPHFLAHGHLAAGALVPLLPDWRTQAIALHLMTPPGTLRPQRVEALIGFLVDRLAKLDCGDSPTEPA